MPIVAPPGTTFLGLDVHKDSISASVLHPDDNVGMVEKFFHDEISIRRFLSRFDDFSRLRACYEAGPTGYELSRLLNSLGLRTDVIAPSMIPKAPGDRVKTDKRDARRLAKLHRAGELTVIRVPTPEEEAIRDLSRTRSDMVSDLSRAKLRMSAFLLRHNLIYRRGKSSWTWLYWEWLRSLKFDDPAMKATFGHYLSAVQLREDSLKAVETDLSKYFMTGPYVDVVNRLAAYRGISHMGALAIASEVCDWRRFSGPRSFMGFCALVPSEYSSGGRTRRGRMSKAGNAHLRFQMIESAWAYHHAANVGRELAKRHELVGPDTIARAWTAQVRLTKRYRRLAERKANKTVVVGAIARELCGFLWAEMHAN